MPKQLKTEIKPFLSSKPSSEVMKEYTRRIEFLKHTIDTEKMVRLYEIWF